MKRQFLALTAILAVCFSLINIAGAQSSSGDIYGRVLDSNGDVIPNAEVTLTNQQTGETRSAKSGNLGDFIFATLQPGAYTVLVKAQGFKELEKKDLNLSASERLSTGDLRLALGSVKETVTVEANATPVQTNSGERSALLDSTQVTNLMSRGRDIMALLDVLPGVVEDGEGNDSLGTFKSPAAMSGTRGDYNGMNMDGISATPRSGSNLDTPLNMDAISEVKVLQNSYQAEYGKGAGSIINVLSKSGGRSFHGAAYDYVRNEAFNARNFFDFEKRDKITGALPPKNKYRYETFGYNVGGPVFIPNHFNTNHDKMFFFFSQEILKNTQPNSTRQFLVPTALERQGDFSHSYNGSKNGVAQPLVLSDPVQIAAGKTCKKVGDPGCFPNPGGTGTGGIIPTNRIDPNTQALLNIFPMPLPGMDPNFAAINGYNYQITDTSDRPVRQEILRIDYNFTNNLKAFIRGMNLHTHDNGTASTANKNTWGPGPMDYTIVGPNVGGTVTWIINPTLVNEFTFGWADWREHQIVPASTMNSLLRANVGFNESMLFSAPGQLTSATNLLGLIPAAKFGGGKTANIAYDNRFPLNNNAYTYSLTEGISKIWGNHQFKVGIQAERATYWQLHSGTSNGEGNFDFTGGNNNSGNGYANGLLGNFNTYSESKNVANQGPVTRILEWYVQDTWKALPRLTLDIGVRFTAGLPQIVRQHMAATLNQSLYNPATAPVLYQDISIAPGTCKNAKQVRAAFNPITKSACDANGNPLSTSIIGQFVGAGYGSWPNGPLPDGIGISGINGYPQGLIDFEGVYTAPRFGFAWDVFGDGKTALRGGFGINYNPRQGSGVLGDTDNTPPLALNVQQFNNSTLSSSLNYYLNPALADFQSPVNIARMLLRNSRQPVAYNASIGIQREIGFATVVDVAYVGSFGRHMGQLTDLGQVPLGSRFGFLDTANLGSNPLTAPNFQNDNFLRYSCCYGSYSQVPVLTFTGNSSYHSLQTQVTHRFSHGMQFGGVWTWSKAMDYNDADKSNIVGGGLSPKVYNYGLATYDRRHVVAINYLFSLPKASRLWDNGFVRNALDGWQVAGITRFNSGAPLFLNGGNNGGSSDYFGSSGNLQFPSGVNTDITGGGPGWRPQIIADRVLPRGDRNYFHYFNPVAFTLPASLVCNPICQLPRDANGSMIIGNGPAVIATGPGIANFNMSLFKNFDVTERVKLQFRVEAYNVFNHTQFSGVNTSPKFDQFGNVANLQVPGATDWFGRVTSARDPRIMQFALRITF